MSQHLFEHHFRYDPVTGKLFWKRPTANCMKPGDEVGAVNFDGYRQCYFKCKQYKVHRIIWEMCHGTAPDGFIDHINGIRDDNRIENLRTATSADNGRNRERLTRNKLGIKGLCVGKGSYCAYVCDQRKYFPLTEEGKRLAVEWLQAQRLAHGEFANHGEHKA